jgi:hypothetical protein
MAKFPSLDKEGTAAVRCDGLRQGWFEAWG